MASDEHKAIAESIDLALRSLADSALVGTFESQRRTFDYSCLIKRDLTRPLVAQVLWQHEHGLDKDIRTLLFDVDAIVKLYVVRDSARIRSTIDDVLTTYRRDPATRPRLAALKLIFVPSDFDADSERQRIWLRSHLAEQFNRDIAFGVLFGGLSRHTLDVFSNHGGPVGLKYAMLHEIVQNGLIRNATFRANIGYKTTGPIREALAILNAAGLIRNWPSSVVYFPTIRGRFLLDFTRKLLLDINDGRGWSDEAVMLFQALGSAPPAYPTEPLDPRTLDPYDRFGRDLLDAEFCKTHYGRDLLSEVDLIQPALYSDFVVDQFIEAMKLAKRFTADFFDEPEHLFFPNPQKPS